MAQTCRVQISLAGSDWDSPPKISERSRARHSERAVSLEYYYEVEPELKVSGTCLVSGFPVLYKMPSELSLIGRGQERCQK
jgi:hypothetical protein